MGDLDTQVDPVEVQNAAVNMRDWVRNVVHKEIGQNIRIIYGGEVDAMKARNLINMRDIDGFLVGKQSLTQEFAWIVNAV